MRSLCLFVGFMITSESEAQVVQRDRFIYHWPLLLRLIKGTLEEVAASSVAPLRYHESDQKRMPEPENVCSIWLLVS